MNNKDKLIKDLNEMSVQNFTNFLCDDGKCQFCVYFVICDGHGHTCCCHDGVRKYLESSFTGGYDYDE